jgi:hypothetical protein
MTPPSLRVRVERAGTEPFERTFTDCFLIGRGVDCQVRLDTDVVSRTHAEVTLENGRWWLTDLGSRNGTWVQGSRIEKTALDGPTRVELSRGGPILRFEVEDLDFDATIVPSSRPDSDDELVPRRARPSPPRASRGDASFKGRADSLEAYVRHYVDDSEPAGDHTMMIRRALATAQTKQRRKHTRVLAAVAAATVLLAGFAAVQYLRLRTGSALQRKLALKQRILAQRAQRHQDAAAQLFDEMKRLDVKVAQLNTVIEASGQRGLAVQLSALAEGRRRMMARYDGYVRDSGLYRKLKPQERVIYKLARVFGESEFGMPSGFVDGVQQMIREYWLSPMGRGRFVRSVQEAESNGYTPYIVRTMHQNGLPAQLFYLAMQESNFNTRAVGPPTRWGRAKGMWQFIPRTALQYGLDPGPYADKSMVDPRDERHDFRKSTDAAARYLQYIYGTLAQASGLLAVASYNWGEDRVSPRLDSLAVGPQAIPLEALDGIPEDPGSRSYWRFLNEYRDRMPDETKDYVLKIFAAAVIGEDPRAFGFDLDNPLERYFEQPDEANQ